MAAVVAASGEEWMDSRALGRWNLQELLGRGRGRGRGAGEGSRGPGWSWPQQDGESFFPFQPLPDTESCVPCFALSWDHGLLEAKYQVLLCPGQHLSQDLLSQRYSVNRCFANDNH